MINTFIVTSIVVTWKPTEIKMFPTEHCVKVSVLESHWFESLAKREL